MANKRFFRHGELPLVIMALLDREPMHGYQLLVELDKMFGDAYDPSSGTVYPATTALEEEGLIESEREGRKTTYRLTDLGKSSLESHRDRLADLELRTGAHILADDTINGRVDKFAAHAKTLATKVGADAITEVLDRASDELTKLANGKGNHDRRQR